MTNHLINRAKILLPADDTDMKKWAVVACDQFTSQPKYWEEVREIIGDEPSTLHLVLPEVHLESENVKDYIEAIHAKNKEYRKLLSRSVDGFVYLERLTQSGLRTGVLATVDLDRYDYKDGTTSAIRPTENTIIDRIPPRLDVRRGCEFEVPHIMMLIDDKAKKIVEPLADLKNDMTKLYDFDLMQGGGHIAGWAVENDAVINSIIDMVDNLMNEPTPAGCAPIAIAAGDGNHSLATAKAYWDEVKQSLTADEKLTHPARYALAEIVNIHCDALTMEPIHRVIFGATDEQAETALKTFFAEDKITEGSDGEHTFEFVTKEGCTSYSLANSKRPLSIYDIEDFIAYFGEKYPAITIDYIHGNDAVKEICKDDVVGFILPPFEKNDLLKGVYLAGALPKKTFSMGHADEKRYYLELREIV